MTQSNDLNKLKIPTYFNNLYKLIKNKNYESIYEYYGKNIYNFFTPQKYKKEDIKKLMEEKKYGLIYNKYDKISRVFVKDLRKKKYDDIYKLIDEGKYLDIYNKYGEKEYNKYILNAYKDDLYSETDDLIKIKLYKTKFEFRSNMKDVLKVILSIPISITFLYSEMCVITYSKTIDNQKIYYDELNEYNKNNELYAQEINSLNLTDLQIIMKVINDIWTNMDGYGNPDKNISGLWRLDLKDENGVGVCRNIADDFTAKINAINPNYNARNLIVYIDEQYYNSNSFSNVKVKFSTSNNQSNNEQNNGQNNDKKVDLAKITGNHMVTIMDIPDKNISLIIDPTNPSIGIYKKGQIEMLSTKDGKGISFMPFGQLLLAPSSIDELIKKDLNSFITDDSYDNDYNIDSQNDALDYVKNIGK